VRDAGRADAAAEAGARTLAPDVLGGWLSQASGRAPTMRDAEAVALIWINYSLLADALGHGETLREPETLAAALEPDQMLLALRAWHDTIEARRPPVPEGTVDSLYQGDTVRLFQQLLIRVTDPSDQEAIARARARADSVLLALAAGSAFDSLAREVSDDPNAPEGGYLPITRRGALPPEFERSTWTLAPGESGGVVSQLGFHVIRRPPLEEVADRFARWADSVATLRADSTHADSLMRASGLVVTDSAVGVLRRYFADPGNAGTPGTAALAGWESGRLPLRDVVMWIEVLPPAGYLDLRGGSDLTLRSFVRDVGLQYLLLAEAAAAGVGLGRPDIDRLEDAYTRQLRGTLALLGVGDSLGPLPAGEAPGRVMGLLEGFATGRVEWRALPAALGAVLRRRSGYALHRPGLAAALEIALRQRTPGG